MDSRVANVVFVHFIVFNLINTVTCISLPHLTGLNEGPVNISQYVPNAARQKRSADGFPNDLDLSLEVEGVAVDLALTRNPDIRDRVPVLLNRRGRVVRHRIPNAVLEEQTVAFYYEQNNGSSFMVWHPGVQSESGEQFVLFGIFSLGPREYQVQPLDPAHVTHTLSLIPDDGPRLTDFVYSNNREHHIVRGRAGRVKRQTQTYEIESFFVVDNTVYLFWDNNIDGSVADRQNVILNAITQFYAFVLNTINARYASMSGRGYTVKCLYSGIYISNVTGDAPFIENNLLADDGSARRKADVNVVLPAFRDWANINLAPTVGYDHAFMFTAYDIGTVSGGEFSAPVVGYAYVGEVCDTSRYSINEDHFKATLGTVAAHELGHNLGMAHDGTGNACSSTDGYIMAPSSTQTFSDYDFNRRKFVFSSCSMDYFDTTLDGLTGNNCMENRSSSYDASALDEFSGDLAGQEYPPDQQCEYMLGSGSYLFRGYYTNYEDICPLMACSITNNNGFYSGLLAWDGTTCGNGKLCVNGSCVTSSSAPTGLTETCVFGDIPYNLHNKSETCVEFLGAANQSHSCYQDNYRKQCCETCAVHKQNNVNRTDCEYGDKASFCATLSLSGCYSNDAACCQSCAERASSDPNCEYGDKASFCATLSLSGCYSNDATCCQSCAERASSDPDCLYGDKTTSCSSLSRTGCYSNEAVCCGTCAALASNNPDCRYGDRASGCVYESCSSYSETTRNTSCCETCAEPTTTTTTTTPATTTTMPTTTTTTTPTTTTTATPTTTTTTPTTTTTTPTTTTTTTPTTTTTITPTTTTTTTPTTTTTATTLTTTTTTTPTTTTTTPTIKTTTPTTTATATQTTTTTTILTTTTTATSITAAPSTATSTTSATSSTTTSPTTSSTTTTPTAFTSSTSTTTTATTTLTPTTTKKKSHAIVCACEGRLLASMTLLAVLLASVATHVPLQ